MVQGNNTGYTGWARIENYPKRADLCYHLIFYFVDVSLNKQKNHLKLVHDQNHIF